ncbi:MAG: copper amine oxidase N-terminal domain-containing protein [Defluviitaleaceae bacterium]|nr:copper amine oxidase N-terminal domain-containing protein [Defluviitaleaceae bacterium]
MFRKLLTSLMITGLAVVLGGVMAYANVQVRLDGQPVQFETQPFIEDGRTMVPFHAIAQMMGIQVGWDGALRQVYYTNPAGVEFVLRVNYQYAIGNGRNIPLDVPPTIVNDRTFVPLRFIAESLGVHVGFEDGIVMLDTTKSPLIGTWAWANATIWRYVFHTDGTGDRGVPGDVMEYFNWHTEDGRLYIRLTAGPGFDNPNYINNEIWAFEIIGPFLEIVSRQVEGMAWSYVRAN